MITLAELFTMNDMDKLKYELPKLVESKEYKKVNLLLSRNPNTWLFNTHELNEEISYDDKHITKCNDVMKFETRPRCASKQTTPRSESPEHRDTYTFKSRYYDLNIKSFKYMDKPIKPYVSTSQIRARY